MRRVSVEMEFLFRASPTILYKFLTTPSCLVRWFCDGVDIQAEEFVFEWGGSEEIAMLVDDIEDERVRFQWEDADHEDEYLEFRMIISPVTNETIMYITDFCDENEVDDQRKLWENQMELLRRETGG
ncbi:MAG: START-like domain-containing protein [Saprospiraceae bacterium]|nr:START-like domain-containing protein [Saprospiraceae bacterium]